MSSTLIERLETENAWLRDRLEFFSGDKVRSEILRGELGLSGQQARILALLMKRKHGTHRDVIYGSVFDKLNGDNPNEKIVDVQVCMLRRRLRERGAPGGIACAYGTSTYRLSDDLRDWVEQFLQGKSK